MWPRARLIRSWRHTGALEHGESTGMDCDRLTSVGLVEILNAVGAGVSGVVDRLRPLRLTPGRVAANGGGTYSVQA